MTDYKPNEVDTEWLRTVLPKIKNGGLLVMPAAMLAYRVDHANKTLTRVGSDWPFSSEETHERTVETCKLIGWKVGT